MMTSKQISYTSSREAVKMQEFMLKLLEEDKLIFVKGNHEELLETMLRDLKESREAFSWGYSYHISNGTWSTALQLTNSDEVFAIRNYSYALFSALLIARTPKGGKR